MSAAATGRPSLSIDTRDAWPSVRMEQVAAMVSLLGSALSPVLREGYAASSDQRLPGESRSGPHARDLRPCRTRGFVAKIDRAPGEAISVERLTVDPGGGLNGAAQLADRPGTSTGP